MLIAWQPEPSFSHLVHGCENWTELNFLCPSKPAEYWQEEKRNDDYGDPNIDQNSMHKYQDRHYHYQSWTEIRVSNLYYRIGWT